MKSDRPMIGERVVILLALPESCPTTGSPAQHRSYMAPTLLRSESSRGSGRGTGDADAGSKSRGVESGVHHTRSLAARRCYRSSKARPASPLHNASSRCSTRSVRPTASRPPIQALRWRLWVDGGSTRSRPRRRRPAGRTGMPSRLDFAHVSAGQDANFALRSPAAPAPSLPGPRAQTAPPVRRRHASFYRQLPIGRPTPRSRCRTI